MSARTSFECAGVSHVGLVRDHNEDNYIVRPEIGIWAVADGMGGHEAGEVASAAIVEALKRIGPASSARDLLTACETELIASNQQIRDVAAARNVDAIGSTVVILLTFDAFFACLWCGDSRAYMVRGNAISQVTVDHTELTELLAAGVITEEEAKTWPSRNVITRAIGVFEEPEIDMNHGELLPGDSFVLCSDGLTNHVESDEILAFVRSHRPQEACDLLIQKALERGGRDNVTVIVVTYRPPTTVVLPQNQIASE